MRRLKLVAIVLVVLLVLIGVAGFFIAPPLLKANLTNQLSDTLKRPVSIQEIRINPYLLTAAVRGFTVMEPSGADKFVSFDELRVQIDFFSVFKRALILKELKLSGPYVRISRNTADTYNFSDLINKFTQPAKDKQKETRPLLFSINNIRIERGALDFWDGPNNTKHTVTDLLVSVPFVANMERMLGTYTEPRISAIINGDPYLLEGKTKPFHESLETVFIVDIKDLSIPYYLAYVPVKMNFKIASGDVDTRLEIAFRQQRDKPASLSVKGDATLRQFVAEEKNGRPLVKIPSLNIKIANIEPLAQLVQLNAVSLSSPEVYVHRDKQGKINLLSLLPADRKQQAKQVEQKPKPPDKPPSPFVIDVGDFRIESGKIAFKDEQPQDPVSVLLSSLDLKVKEFSTKQGASYAIELATLFGKGGRIAVSGPLALDPLSAELAVKLRGIDIRALQGYFNDKVRITVTSGAVTAEGKVGVKDVGQKGLSATYDGQCLVADFKSIDKSDAAEFLSWKSLSIGGLSAGYNPLSVSIKKVALADFFANVIVHEDGVLNLQKVLVTETPPEQAATATAAEKTADAEKKEPAPPAAAPDVKQGKEPGAPIRIDAVAVQGGLIEFTDRFIKPNFTASLNEIGGRISGLSSIGEKPAELELRGKYNKHMPLEITGNIHPLRDDLFIDLKASFRDMDLSSKSPYSGRYIGYALEKGKLSFDLKYLVEKKQLSAENKIFIDQLTLGNKVDSPQATNLPVGLAISLLKDRQGQINLDVPLTGSIDDPKFSLWRLIVQVIVNLLTKAVTAPFALIGSLVGGGAELGYLEFDYGLATITEANLKKIMALSKALYERPALKLDIVGYVDPDHDREALKRAQMERKIKGRKLNDMIRQNLPAIPVDDVIVAPGEYEKYLTQAYNEETFPKPRTPAGMVKALPVAEMEKLMLTHAIVKDDDLKMLGGRRAAAVRDEFLKTGQVGSDRIFMIEPKTPAPEKKEKLKDSRVEFKLK